MAARASTPREKPCLSLSLSLHLSLSLVIRSDRERDARRDRSGSRLVSRQIRSRDISKVLSRDPLISHASLGGRHL